MSKVTVWFIKSALIYLVLAVVLGLLMAVKGPVTPYRQIHTHLNLLGWMSMMIYGVAYHILPRFSGMPLWSERLSYWHLYLANIGLVGMASGWLASAFGCGYAVLIFFSLVEAVAISFFVVNMFKTVRTAPVFNKPA